MYQCFTMTVLKIYTRVHGFSRSIHDKPTADATLLTNGGRKRYVEYVDMAIIETARASVELG